MAAPVKKFANVWSEVALLNLATAAATECFSGAKGLVESAVVEDCGGEAQRCGAPQVNGRFPEQLQAKTESQRFSEILSHHFNKVPRGAGSKQKATNKRGCCCKAFIEGKRKEDTTQQSTTGPQPTSSDLRGVGRSEALTAEALSLRPGNRRPRSSELWMKTAAARSQTAAR